MSKRRTNPGYLSDEEAARDRARTVELVRGITKVEEVNLGILVSNEVNHPWYFDRLCDACGSMLQKDNWRCEKCDVSFCNKCGIEISLTQKKDFPQCLMCDQKLVNGNDQR